MDIPCDNYLTTGLSNFAALPEGTTLFNVLAMSAPGEAPVSIGALVTTGNFTTSRFGDEQLFFKASFFKGYVRKGETCGEMMWDMCSFTHVCGETRFFPFFKLVFVIWVESHQLFSCLTSSPTYLMKTLKTPTLA